LFRNAFATPVATLVDVEARAVSIGLGGVGADGLEILPSYCTWMYNIQHRRKLVDRFWSKVRKTPNCWELTANKNNKGYGMIRIGPASEGLIVASRMSYILEHGSIPEGKWVLHTCDNRLCVRPSHLFLGDHTDNMRDMRAKGRGRSLIGPGDAVTIRKLRMNGVNRAAIAAQFGISVATVKNITMRRTWKHV
jgi:hypothetical protein